jgi:D-alanyl-D-alanine carboxypeptidase (penicillin-binding protein 5/6)
MPEIKSSPLHYFAPLLAACLVAILTVVASACGGDGGGDDPTPSPSNTSALVPPETTPVVTPEPETTPESTPGPEPGPTEPPATSLSAADMPASTASGAIVLDTASGAALWEQSADLALAPASVAKIATAVVALEQGSLDAVITASVDSRPMAAAGQTVMGLEPGDQITLRDLLYGLMLPSGNDAAIEIAIHISGSEGAFVGELNALAARLGLANTSFSTVHGLDAPGEYTSARDLATLTQHAFGLPEFGSIVSSTRYTVSGSRTYEIKNFSLFLYSYPYADGVKSGYTVTAGDTLVASASRGGVRVIVVLLNTPEYENEAALLMDWAFAALGV